MFSPYITRLSSNLVTTKRGFCDLDIRPPPPGKRLGEKRDSQRKFKSPP